jgi:hypothetical protein
MIKATVVVRDKKNKTVFTKTWETKDMYVAAGKFAKMYPDCWVNVTADAYNFVAMQPANMAADQALVDSGKMSINKFMTKWYGKQPSKKLVEQELIDEYGEEDLV